MVMSEHEITSSAILNIMFNMTLVSENTVAFVPCHVVMFEVLLLSNAVSQ